MSNFKKALRTKESKEAIGDLVITWLNTGSADKGTDAMISTAKRNGAYNQVKIGLITDILDIVFDYFK